MTRVVDPIFRLLKLAELLKADVKTVIFTSRSDRHLDTRIAHFHDQIQFLEFLFRDGVSIDQVVI